MAKQEVTYTQVMTDLKNKLYKPIYFLMGEEPYYIDKISDYITDHVLTDDEKEFNQTVLYGKDVDIRTVINNAKQFPMMSQHRVVVVKEAQNIKSFDDLVYYAQKPLNSTILVICYKYGKMDKRKKYAVEVAKAGVVFESKKLYDNQLAPFVAAYLKDKKVSIDNKATMMITEFIGNDLSRIVSELDKLLITKPENVNTITPDLVEKNIGISKEFNNYELLAALIRKDALKAYRIVQYFEQNPKNNPLVLTLTVLFNFFSNLMLYYYLPDRRNEYAVAAELKVTPYFVKDYILAGQTFSGMKTMQIIDHIRTCDAKGKGVANSSASHGELLQELVSKILH